MRELTDELIRGAVKRFPDLWQGSWEKTFAYVRAQQHESRASAERALAQSEAADLLKIHGTDYSLK